MNAPARVYRSLADIDADPELDEGVRRDLLAAANFLIEERAWEQSRGQSGAADGDRLPASPPLRVLAPANPPDRDSARLQRALELIGRRWSGCILQALLVEGELNYNGLLKGISGISDRVLTERLRELQSEGLLARAVNPGPPLRVRYRITDRGASLGPVFEALEVWASGGGEQ